MAYTTIDDPKDYFSVNTWTADDSSPRSFTGFGHQPDLLWHTHRGSGSINHTITDSVRGGDKQLTTVTTAAEDAASHGEVTAFGSDGITVEDGTSGSYPKLYFNDLDPFGASVGGEYVCWSWKETATAGFDIVAYTGNAVDGRTIAHSLSAVPDMYIVKNRSATEPWMVYHGTLGNTKALYLNDTIAVATSNSYTNDTSPTSSVFSVSDWEGNNGDGNSLIAYLFTAKQGFSKFGSYVGNGDADGTFVYTGFRPAFLMVKETGNVSSWRIVDHKRSTTNVMNLTLYANDGAAEATSAHETDFLSNGFKLRSDDTNMNRDGGVFIYMAFAESPFVNSNGVPTNAR